MATVLPLTYHPDPLLRKPSQELLVDEVKKPEIKTLIADMYATMKENRGVGLAAVQVGKPIRLIIVETKEGLLTLINPVITKKSLRKDWSEEGCLSIPGVFGQVRRSIKIDVVGLDENGNKVAFEAAGMFARVIQHEVDHTNGILFIDTAKDITEDKTAAKK